MEVARTSFNVSSTPAIPEPIIPKINGNLCLIFTPKIAGSVTPRKADTEDVTAKPLLFCCLYTKNIPNAAAPCAILDKASIGQRNVLFCVPINCTSTARNVWCMPVITSRE
ncbi:hypothetical protein D3C77_472010 [compost metagenome]